LKVTLPVIVPAVAEVTVAVNVTACPGADGFSDDISAVVVDASAIVIEPFVTDSVPSDTDSVTVPVALDSVADAGSIVSVIEPPDSAPAAIVTLRVPMMFPGGAASGVSRIGVALAKEPT
jgi:hypothetical protein